MPTNTVDDVRSSLLQVLLDKVNSEPYPSATMLNIIESLLKPDEVPDYVEHLVDKVRADTYPSIDMLKRIQQFV
ncbi:hypothetical protein [Arthrobacter sp. H14]|uniref:hypothetical protein n=1 Tax=Arthrobacter sp. H14 TaxID=1312959 RepID=UPI00047EB364|nr:hypothetical protein [Arthrobacter sp. H14]